MFFWLFLLSRNYKRRKKLWKSCRVVEGARLESVFTWFKRNEGSNPSSSGSKLNLLLFLNLCNHNVIPLCLSLKIAASITISSA